MEAASAEHGGEVTCYGVHCAAGASFSLCMVVVLEAEIISQNDTFRVVFDACADDVSIPVNNLIVSYEGKRIYPSASPHGIGVWAEAELGASS